MHILKKKCIFHNVKHTVLWIPHLNCKILAKICHWYRKFYNIWCSIWLKLESIYISGSYLLLQFAWKKTCATSKIYIKIRRYGLIANDTFLQLRPNDKKTQLKLTIRPFKNWAKPYAYCAVAHFNFFIILRHMLLR